MWRSVFVCFALSLFVLQTAAAASPTTEWSSHEDAGALDSLASPTSSSEYFIPKLLQILQREWNNLMKKFNTIAKADGLSDIQIIRRRELGIVA